ncbi:hypothetical protein BASA50_011004 [Batrachochytrium salamandrivorans]|uniref:Uncharacterized protein n=1 Tax=Batrachochytrium salamandrivorans TaxID=1357716 RepID=A0ABQ8EWY2_9FUNG|nr:hypothetical protein BASA50_011004 [Batrachochytrium salamandrivorans]
MRISTGIILSILSTNVFAIEHPNGAHSGSLLARRAVVADTDGLFLQKRTNDGDQKKQAKPKTSVPNSHQEGYVYDNPAFENYPNPDSNPNLDTGKGPANFPEYVPDQDDEDQDERKNVYTGLDVDQGRSSFVDALRDSPSQAFSHIKNRLSRAKLELGLALSKESALTSSDTVASRLGGEKGVAIGKAVYEMFLYALETSMCYKGLYKGSAKSPFGLKLASSTLSGLKKRYNGLQDDVLRRIKLYISAIKAVIEQISISPKNVIFLLERIMESTDNFYGFILNARSRYSRLSKDLKISDKKHLEGLEMHVRAVETYKCGLSGQFNKIKDMVEDHRKNSDHKSLSKALLFSMGFKGHSEVRTKPSKD